MKNKIEINYINKLSLKVTKFTFLLIYTGISTNVLYVDPLCKRINITSSNSSKI